MSPFMMERPGAARPLLTVRAPEKILLHTIGAARSCTIEKIALRPDRRRAGIQRLDATVLGSSHRGPCSFTGAS